MLCSVFKGCLKLFSDSWGLEESSFEFSKFKKLGICFSTVGNLLNWLSFFQKLFSTILFPLEAFFFKRCFSRSFSGSERVFSPPNCFPSLFKAFVFCVNLRYCLVV